MYSVIGCFAHCSRVVSLQIEYVVVCCVIVSLSMQRGMLVALNEMCLLFPAVLGLL